MRLLTVRHVTTYRYADPVRLGDHWMMFRPREGHDLRLVSTHLEISPRPVGLRWLHDVFDNSLAVATFDGETTELRFESRVTLEHYEVDAPDYQIEASARLFPFFYPSDDSANLQRALESRHHSPEVTRWARDFVASLGPGPVETMALLQAMTHAIRRRFDYVRRTERGVQTPAETLGLGAGSCRDFALFMIEAVRTLGLAARFVSGYIFVPDLAESGIVGGGATHAWLQVYLPGAGWVDFDPTNSIIGNRNLIRVAVAWDPADALPLWGTYIGSSRSFLGLDVTVSVTDGNLCQES
jgi:transglutaminase-like putative cysteine protease